MNDKVPVKRVRPRVNKLKQAQEAAVAEAKQAEAPPIEAQPPAINMRPDMRPDMREDDPRERAARRAAEITEHLGDLDEGTDEFYIDPAIIPKDWDYEWKRRLLLNKEDPAYEVAVARTGWTAVPRARHANMMPSDSSAVSIERKGMILMERPKVITDRARAIEARKAALQVRVKEEQLSAAGQGQFARDNKGNSLVQVKKGYEAAPIPK